jgi:hypothetical protein
MNAEHLAYPWRKDLEELGKAVLENLTDIRQRITRLENRISDIERYLPNQKEPEVHTYTTANSAGGQINPGAAGGTYGYSSSGSKKK